MTEQRNEGGLSLTEVEAFVHELQALYGSEETETVGHAYSDRFDPAEVAQWHHDHHKGSPKDREKVEKDIEHADSMAEWFARFAAELRRLRRTPGSKYQVWGQES